MLPTYLGVFLLSMASLAFEITLTRVFSVAQWYHFAFMTVSIALLGLGASGSFLALFPSLARDPHHPSPGPSPRRGGEGFSPFPRREGGQGVRLARRRASALIAWAGSSRERT